MMGQTVAEIKKALLQVNEEEFAQMQRALAADTRAGVIAALKSTQKRLAAQREELFRVKKMYAYDMEVASKLDYTTLNEKPLNERVILGLDEVGRGPVAGPVAIGAVVLRPSDYILGINDSKKLSAHAREEVAREIKNRALVCEVVFVDAERIDSCGISECLRFAFSEGIQRACNLGFKPDAILLDGNPLHLHEREVSIVSGDAKCASIAAASVVAKVERDALMDKLASEYPMYGWQKNKGYGSAAHIEAIKKYGLSPYHRKTFCRNFIQETLF